MVAGGAPWNRAARLGCCGRSVAIRSETKLLRELNAPAGDETPNGFGHLRASHLRPLLKSIHDRFRKLLVSGSQALQNRCFNLCGDRHSVDLHEIRQPGRQQLNSESTIIASCISASPDIHKLARFNVTTTIELERPHIDSTSVRIAKRGQAARSQLSRSPLTPQTASSSSWFAVRDKGAMLEKRLGSVHREPFRC